MKRKETYIKKLIDNHKRWLSSGGIAGPRIDLWDENLTNAHFGQANLTNAIIRASKLRNSNFWGGTLVNIDFTLSDLSDSDLKLSNIVNGNFTEATVINARIIEANLSGAKFFKSNLDGSRFVASKFNNLPDNQHNSYSGPIEFANFTNASLKACDLSYSDLRHCIFTNADLSEATLTGAKLFPLLNANWIINDVKCDFVFLDEDGLNRIPKNRNFEHNEFCETYNEMIDMKSQLEKIINRKGLGHVFISYIEEDLEKVIKIKEELERAGISVWIDKEELLPGVNWEYAIRKAILEGIFFVACFSESSSKKSSYMKKEIRIALTELEKMTDDTVWFIPIKLSACEMPVIKSENGISLENIQWVDLSDNWRYGINKIIKVIKQKTTE